MANTSKRTPAQIHQRKQSSSKTPNPPKDETRNIATAAKASAEETKASSTSQTDGSSSPRNRKRKPKETVLEVAPIKEIVDAQLNLPSVPSTHRINPLDIQVASFFSQHRPISVSQVIPSAVTTEAFTSLFDPPKPSSKSKFGDVIYTLSSAVDTLDQAIIQQETRTPEEVDVRTAVTQASSSNAEDKPRTSDLPAKTFHINLKDLAKNFRPFVPPPPPVPLGAMREAARISAKEQKDKSQGAKQTTWTSTLTVYESTHANGKKTYKTFASPIIQAPGNATLPPPNSREIETVEEHDHSDALDHQDPDQQIRQRRELPPYPAKQPFLGRMRERQLSYEDRMEERFGQSSGEIMQAISVKRQRKLKMKKHKYKKLMKRTKNLRRRLDRT